MNESLLTSLDDSIELSNKENNNETFSSYSLIFDKAKQNFSTSSEISFLKHNLSLNDQNETITKHIPIEEESIKFNPFLLLFTDNDQLQLDEINRNIDIDRKELVNSEITQCTNPGDDLLNMKPFVFDEQRQSKRSSFKNRRRNASSDDGQAFEKFLQEHRTPKPIKNENKSSIELRKKNRNSLKDFICDSSSSSNEEDPAEFYPKVNRLIEKDSTWRKNDDDDSTDHDDDEYPSDESSQSSRTSSESDDDRPKTKKKTGKVEVSYLESLSNYVPLEDKHPDAKQYFIRTGFKNKTKRQELAEKLFSIYDKDIFSSKLSDKVTIVWSARLTATAGHCTTRRSTQTATITLSHKVCDSPERCRDTLLHELCHAAVSLIDGVMNEGHGPLWRQWTRKAERFYPYLPAISVKHTYDISYKFIYRCIVCHYQVYRHSKSLDVENDACGKCMGKFELFLNNHKNKATSEQQTPKKTLTKYNLFIKENFQKIKQEQPHLSTPQLMKHLSQQYKKNNQQPQQQQNDLDLPNLEQLKI